MTDFLFPPARTVSLPVLGEKAEYPINRIFCVGQNYAAHAAEMGATADRAAPFYFLKGPHAVFPSGGILPFAPETADYHHEVELVVALGGPLFRAKAAETTAAIFGFGVGLDMTRRDLQRAAKEKSRPWDVAKNVESSAVLTPLTLAKDFGAIAAQRIHLSVNGKLRQEGRLNDQVHAVPEILADLSRFYHLGAGDLVLTGTPAGVGPVEPGDILTGGIDGLAPLRVEIGARA